MISMKLKSYFSATVEAAVEQARQELGEDALLVNARPSTPDTRHLGAYEVVFGAAGAPQVPAAASARFPRLNAVTAPKNEGRNTAANGTLARTSPKCAAKLSGWRTRCAERAWSGA
jgi:flagellar biosynthesis GTPase FlhF